MGKKRRRAVVLETEPAEFNSLYFDNAVPPSSPAKTEPSTYEATRNNAIANTTATTNANANANANTNANANSDATSVADVKIPTQRNSPKSPERPDRVEEYNYIDESEEIDAVPSLPSLAEPQRRNSRSRARNPQTQNLVENGAHADDAHADEVIVISDTTYDSEDIIDLVSSSPPRKRPAPAPAPVPASRELSAEASPSTLPSPPVPEFVVPARKALPPVQLTIDCQIPGKETRRTEEWKASASFYGLDKEFGHDCVLVFENKVLKKYLTPAKVDPNATELHLEVITDLQWRKREVGIEDDSHVQSDTPNDVDALESEGRFPVTLDGKYGPERILVSRASLVKDLVAHYLKAKNIKADTPVKVKFDGDTVEPLDTIKDVDVEANDKLDLYVQN